MQSSHYVKVYPFPDDDELVLLLSTRTGAIAAIPKDVWSELEKGGKPDDELVEVLEPLGMLVASAEEEIGETHNLLAAINNNRQGDQVAVILNLRCNFACPYCYESGIMDGAEMSPETADALVEFIKSRWREDQQELVLQFYGGEPLLSEGLISRIAGELKPFAESKGGKFWFSLVTNASLLRKEVVERLAPLGLEGAKVTLDGPKSSHDRSRPTLAGGPTFERIISNLRECAGSLRLSIGGNFTRENYAEFTELLDHLLEVGLGPEEIEQIQFNPVMHVDGVQAVGEHLSGCVTVNEPWVSKATTELHCAVLKRGFSAPEILPSPCAVDIETTFSVHVNGAITKCPALVGDTRFEVGDLTSGMRGIDKVFGAQSWRAHKKCATCEYLPLCFGGCRFMSLQRSGDIKGLDCKKLHFDSVLPKMIANQV